VDAKSGKVAGRRLAGLRPDSRPAAGAKEQHPHTWREATAGAIRQALRGAKASPTEVKAIGLRRTAAWLRAARQGRRGHPSGQALVRHVHRPECEEITAKLGGAKKTIRTLGNAVLPGFTASKILWLKNHELKTTRGWPRCCCPMTF